METVETIVPTKHQSILLSSIKKLFKAVPIEEKKDPLLDGNTRAYERRLIVHYRKEGMSDEEIRKWLNQL